MAAQGRQRSAVRDAVDAAKLLELLPELTLRPRFRTAFVCFLAASRTDARDFRPGRNLFPDSALEQDLSPLLRRGQGGPVRSCRELATWILKTVTPALEPLLSWSVGERRFLDHLLDRGEIDAAALHEDPAVRDRILRQPMLEWKAAHVRVHREG
ncbi:MAG: hypothetical protein MUE73_21470 [Planctomycetes bacterium]|nr:hypothetical protein [Planctomycetota bacterium]